jgi:hypothetical protein
VVSSGLRIGLIFFMFLSCAAVLAAPGQLRAQDPDEPGNSTSETRAVVPATAPYVEPTESMKLHNYSFDAFGPYPLTVSAFVAGYHQARRIPPDWREGWPGYGERYGSDFGISAVNITTRYTLAEALHEDTLYYSCGCKGISRRLLHAVVSAAIARRGQDGHQVFGLPGVVAPYIGPLVAVPAWYPNRYSAKDAFRMGNFGLMDYAIGNIGLEFLPGLLRPKSSSWIRRWHFDNRHAARLGESAP